jgi:hypothetical protein
MANYSKRQMEFLKQVQKDLLPKDLNKGLLPTSSLDLRRFLGEPSENYTTQCSNVTTSPRLKMRIVTESVGPFRVTGVDVFVASLRMVMCAIKRKDPELSAMLSSAGMWCIRRMRGTSIPSIHSWAGAVDLKIGGVLDQMGDGKILKGHVALAPYFNVEGWYCGSGFRTREDAMHYEVGKAMALRLLNLNGVDRLSYIEKSKTEMKKLWSSQ